MHVRAENRDDWEAISAVTEAAFGTARESRIIEAIRDSDGFVPALSLVAEDGGQVVGHLMLSYVTLAETGRRVLELGPMCVAPPRQREGIGSSLVRSSLRAADSKGEPLILVLGHPTYYPRFGFVPASELGITPPDPSTPDDAFMVIRLRGYEPALRGRIVFPPAFLLD